MARPMCEGLLAVRTGTSGSLWQLADTSPIARGSELCRIGRITPAGTVTEFPVNGFMVGSRFGGITAGPDGNLWFMDSGDFPDSGKIGRITPTGDITFFSIPLIASAGTFQDIVAGPDGSLWFTDRYLAVGPGCCDTGGRIDSVAVTGQVTEFPVRIPGCYLNTLKPFCGYPTGIALGPDDDVWFAHHFSNLIMRIAGDVEPAGLASLVWRETTTGDVGLWSLSGASVRSETPLATSVPLEWHVAVTGDLDGNGTDDLSGAIVRMVTSPPG